MNTSLFEHRCASGQIIRLVHGDLTLESVDAIVNAANGQLVHGGGVAAAIVRKGGSVIQDESSRHVATNGPVQTGQVAMTGAGSLPCKAVIHAVGPVWQNGTLDEEALLHSAVWKSLELANTSYFRSIAIPAISSGIFGFPKDRCAKILVQAAVDFFHKNPRSQLREIRFTLIDKPTVDVFLAEFQKRF